MASDPRHFKAPLSRKSLTEAHLSYLCKPLEEAFKVSQLVIEKRLLREKLWPLTP